MLMSQTLETGADPATESANSLVPLSNALEQLQSLLGPFDLYGSTSADPLLRSKRELVCQVFQTVDCPENLELSVAALRVIEDMTNSPHFAPSTSGQYAPHKLYTILEAAGLLESVRQAYVHRLEREETETMQLWSTLQQRDIMSNNGLDSELVHAFGLTNLIRLQIVDYLIRYGGERSNGYNLAHFLLGLPLPNSFEQSNSTFSGGKTINAGLILGDPKKPGTPTTCLHIILELLDYGLGEPSSPIITVDHPSLAERLYKLIAILLRSPTTCHPTRQLLRVLYDFSSRQVTFFSSPLLDITDLSFTIYDLRQRAWLFQAVASDLYLALGSQEYSYAERLVKVILGKGNENYATTTTTTTTTAATTAANTTTGAITNTAAKQASLADKEQRPKILQFLLGLEEALILLSNEEKLIEANIHNALAGSFSFALTSITRILEIVLLPISTTDKLASSWTATSTLVSIIKPLLPQVHLVLLRMLIHPALPVVSIENITSLLLVLTKTHFLILNYQPSQSDVKSIASANVHGIGDVDLDATSLPNINDQFEALLEGVLRPDASLAARGYVYAGMMYILQQCFKDQYISESSLNRSQIVSLLKDNLTRILPILAADAITITTSEHESWSTLAINMLTVLIKVFASENLTFLLFDNLARLGVFKALLLSLRPSESRLAVILQMDTSTDFSLNPLFLWKAKFAFLEQMCLRPSGLEKLIELGLVEGIGELSVFSWRIGDPLSAKAPTCMAPLLQNRLDQILEPVLRVLALVLVNCGEAILVKSKIRTFLGTHQESLISILHSRIGSALEDVASSKANDGKFEQYKKPELLGISQDHQAFDRIEKTCNVEYQLVHYVCIIFNGVVGEEETPSLVPISRTLFSNLIIKCLSRLEQTVFYDQSPQCTIEVLAEAVTFLRARALKVPDVFVTGVNNNGIGTIGGMSRTGLDKEATGLAELARMGQLSVSLLGRLMTAVVKHIRGQMERQSRKEEKSNLVNADCDDMEIRTKVQSRLLFIWDNLLCLTWTHVSYLSSMKSGGGNTVGNANASATGAMGSSTNSSINSTYGPFLKAGTNDAELRAYSNAVTPSIDAFATLHVQPDQYGRDYPMRPVTVQRWMRQIKHTLSALST